MSFVGNLEDLSLEGLNAALASLSALDAPAVSRLFTAVLTAKDEALAAGEHVRRLLAPAEPTRPGSQAARANGRGPGKGSPSPERERSETRRVCRMGKKRLMPQRRPSRHGVEAPFRAEADER